MLLKDKIEKYYKKGYYSKDDLKKIVAAQPQNFTIEDYERITGESYDAK